MPFNHLILCHPLLLLPSIFPSIRIFSKEWAPHIMWPKYWNFNFSISPSNEYSGLISFRMDWLDLLAVQGTLKSLLQHHSSKTSILRCFSFHNSACHCVSPKLPIKDLLPEKSQQAAIQTAVSNLATHQESPGCFRTSLEPQMHPNQLNQTSAGGAPPGIFKAPQVITKCRQDWESLFIVLIYSGFYVLRCFFSQ